MSSRSKVASTQREMERAGEGKRDMKSDERIRKKQTAGEKRQEGPREGQTEATAVSYGKTFQPVTLHKKDSVRMCVHVCTSTVQSLYILYYENKNT